MYLNVLSGLNKTHQNTLIAIAIVDTVGHARIRASKDSAVRSTQTVETSTSSVLRWSGAAAPRHPTSEEFHGRGLSGARRRGRWCGCADALQPLGLHESMSTDGRPSYTELDSASW